MRTLDALQTSVPWRWAAAQRQLTSRGDRDTLAELFARADIILDGARPHDIQIRDPRAYRAILSGSLGFGEAYMDGWWDCEALDELAYRLFHARVEPLRLSARTLWRVGLAHAFNLQDELRASKVAEAHYDIGNDLFEQMLDPNLVYTCGYWREADTLAEAQTAKLDLVCRKLGLKPGMRVLDIGCGYGSWMKHAAERYGVECVGYSVSKQQTERGQDLCAGLPVRFVLEDYRSIEGTFDRVVSIGMLEAVGYRNFRTYMEVVARSLAPDGLALIHTVGGNVSERRGDPWVDRYIFPNGMLPSIAQLGRAIEGLLVMEDWHNFGPDYDRTLRAWNDNFQAAWPSLSASYSRRFKRMWELYLLSFAGSFRARHIHLWQIVLNKPGTAQPECRVS